MASKSDTGCENSILRFPEEVEKAIEEILPSQDPLDNPNFDAIHYINQLFPTEQSLTNLDDVMNDMRGKVQTIDEDIRKIVRNQTHSGKDAANALDEAQNAIIKLFSQIRDIKQKAGESESMVRDITRDIKQLDTAKRNLTTAITTLNHLHMLVGGVTTLQVQTQNRQYEDAAMLLQGLMEVLDHFKHFNEIPQIKELSDEVREVRRILSDQINSDFHEALEGENAAHFVPNRQLAGACLVVDVLEPKVKKNLLKWLVTREMAEYKIIFAENEDGTWLDKVENRYNWLKRHLIEFEERLGPMFPHHWEMSERIAVEFCDLTKKELEKIMFKRKHAIDTKLLLHAVQKTSSFESLLSRRFTGITIQQFKKDKIEALELSKKTAATNPFEEEDTIKDPNNPFYEDQNETSENNQSKEETLNNPFLGLISSCFEPYLSVYIESQDRNLMDLVERAAQEQKNRGWNNMASEGSSVLHSCGDLFMFYKKCMVQCVQLSTGEPLLALTNVFKKYLRSYANKVLISNLPKTSTTTTTATTTSSSSSSIVPSASMTSITKEFKDFSTTALQNFQSLLKEGEPVKLNDDEKVLICTFLVTSEYCLETTQQLEGKLKEKIDSHLSDKVNMTPEQDVYHSVINSCIQLLVQDLEVHCDGALLNMKQIIWSSIENVGDQSPYVTMISNEIKNSIPLIRDNLVNSKKYFTLFCVRFVSSFIPKYHQSIFRCKPIQTVGAEQLLLDTHSVKTSLLDLPLAGLAVKPSHGKAPPNYTKIVVKGMTRAEMTLKVVMLTANPMEEFVEQCVKLVPDIDSGEFQKVLDMKSIRKSDQYPFIEYFKTTAPQNDGHHQLLPSSSSNVVPSIEESKIKKLENLIKKKGGFSN